MILRVVPEGGPLAAWVERVTFAANSIDIPAVSGLGLPVAISGLEPDDAGTPFVTASNINAGWAGGTPAIPLAFIPFAAGVAIVGFSNIFPVATGLNALPFDVELFIARPINLRK